jgi:hypothetical protein
MFAGHDARLLRAPGRRRRWHGRRGRCCGAGRNLQGDVMSEQLENTILIFLRRLDQKVDRLIDDVSDLKLRVSAVEAAVARVDSRLDRLEHRFDVLERRQDSFEAFHKS